MDSYKMAKKEGDFSEVSYVFGIVSIVLAFFQPLLGFVFGVIGFVHSRKQKTPLSNKARKLNIIGMILNGVLAIVAVFLAVYFTSTGVSPFN